MYNNHYADNNPNPLWTLLASGYCTAVRDCILVHIYTFSILIINSAFEMLCPRNENMVCSISVKNFTWPVYYLPGINRGVYWNIYIMLLFVGTAQFNLFFHSEFKIRLYSELKIKIHILFKDIICIESKTIY